MPIPDKPAQTADSSMSRLGSHTHLSAPVPSDSLGNKRTIFILFYLRTLRHFIPVNSSYNMRNETSKISSVFQLE